MDPKTTNRTIAKADAIAELLEHVGWQEHLKPELLRLRETSVQALTKTTLGLAKDQSPEQLAGLVYSIDFFITVIERALVRGDQAYHEVAKAREQLMRSNELN